MKRAGKCQDKFQDEIRAGRPSLVRIETKRNQNSIGLVLLPTGLNKPRRPVSNLCEYNYENIPTFNSFLRDLDWVCHRRGRTGSGRGQAAQEQEPPGPIGAPAGERPAADHSADPKGPAERERDAANAEPRPAIFTPDLQS